MLCGLCASKSCGEGVKLRGSRDNVTMLISINIEHRELATISLANFSIKAARICSYHLR